MSFHYQIGEAAALIECGLLSPAEHTKTARATKEERATYNRKLQARFQRLRKALRRYGKKTGTGHKRIIIPKRVLTRRDISRLGFVPVTAAVPEAGQIRFRSFRHPDNKYHLHEHRRKWTMHKDDSAASTMIDYKQRMEDEAAGKTSLIPGSAAMRTLWSTIKGMPHTIAEGVPGMAYYLGGRLTGAPPITEKLKAKISPDYFDKIERWKKLGPVSKPDVLAPPKIVEPAPIAAPAPMTTPPLAKAAQS